MRLSGLTEFEYLEGTERVNLFLDTPKKWSRVQATEVAKGIALYASVNQQVLVLLGRKVAAAFGTTATPFYQDTALFPLEYEKSGRYQLGSVPAYAIPHTSGLCREWNDPDVRARAQVFFGHVRDRVREYIDAEYP
jgi:hypothetical protein